MLKHELIRAALQGFALTRAARFLPQPDDAAGFVVTLHHVRPQAKVSGFEPNALLSITPDFLEAFVSAFIGNGWTFVTTDAAIAEGDVARPRRIAVTLDDGYRDNLEHALPVFRRHKVPFTIYVCPGLTERTSELWWAALERVIAGADDISLTGHGPADALETRTPAQKRRAFALWRSWLTTKVDETQQRVAIRALAAKYGLDLPALAAELVMDWDEVRRIAADPLCTIGAHTMTHPALARLAPQDALREMARSAERIAVETGVRPRTIAFPYGYPAAAGAREGGLAEQAGFAGSFTTQPGYVRRAGSRHALPRVSVNGLFQDVKYLKALLDPGFWKLRETLGKRG